MSGVPRISPDIQTEDLIFSIHKDFDSLRNLESKLPVFLISSNAAAQTDPPQYQMIFTEGRGGILSWSTRRQPLELRSRTIGKKERGIIIEAFTKFEFIVNVLVYVAFGVYKNQSRRRRVKENWFDSPFIGFSVKQNLLHDMGFLKLGTVNKINKAKKVRNALAHSYLHHASDRIAQSDMEADLKQHGVMLTSRVISTIYADAWDSLIADYKVHQKHVKEYVIGLLATKNLVEVEGVESPSGKDG